MTRDLELCALLDAAVARAVGWLIDDADQAKPVIRQRIGEDPRLHPRSPSRSDLDARLAVEAASWLRSCSPIIDSAGLWTVRVETIEGASAIGTGAAFCEACSRAICTAFEMRERARREMQDG